MCVYKRICRIRLFDPGTPGVGKSKLCEELIRNGLDMEWIEVGQVAKQCNCFSGYDEHLECHVLNEDKVRTVRRLIDLFINDCRRRFSVIGRVRI